MPKGPSQLWSRALVAAFAGAAGLSLVVVLALSIRVLPWLFAPRVGWQPALVFLTALGAHTFDAVLAASLPLSWGFLVVRCHEQSWVAAYKLCGRAPWQALAATLPAMALLLAVGAGGQVWLLKRAGTTTAVARGLIRQAKARCQGQSPPLAEVPMLNMVWVCPPGKAARLMRPMGSKAVFTAEKVALGNGLRQVRLRRAELVLRGKEIWRLKVKDAQAVGIPPMTKGDRSTPLKRSLWFWLAAALASISLFWAGWHRQSLTRLGVLAGAVAAFGVIFGGSTWGAKVGYALPWMGAIGAAALVLPASVIFAQPWLRARFQRPLYPPTQKELPPPPIARCRLTPWVVVPPLWDGLARVNSYLLLLWCCCCLARRAWQILAKALAKVLKTSKRASKRARTSPRN